MKREYMDYSKSSTPALAKEAAELECLFNRMRRVESFLQNNSEDSTFKEMYDAADGTASYLIHLQNELLIILFDRFAEEFGIKQYWKDNPDEDWLDEEHFLAWYRTLAKEQVASEKRYHTSQWIEYWAERLGKEDKQ